MNYLHLTPGDALPGNPPTTTPFIAVLACEGATTTQWRADCCEWLAQTGCRYLLAWGVDCDAWHDAMEAANLAQCDYGEIPPSRFIMTTTHPDETLDNVAWFAREFARHPAVAIGTQVQFIDVGPEDQRVAYAALFDETVA